MADSSVKSAQGLHSKMIAFKDMTDEQEKEKDWKEMSPLIKNTLFFVAFAYEGEDINLPVNDGNMHFFPGAGTKINQGTNPPDLCGFIPAPQADGRLMRFRTIKNPMLGEEWLSAFTSIEEMLPIWQGRAHFALATFDDMKDLYKPSKGIIINPLSGCLRVPPEKIEFIDKETKKN